MPPPVLILGGTFDARMLARRLAARGDMDVTLSLAGRTLDPVEQGVPVRSGGFGGANGLATYLRENAIRLLIDATHPYAAQISANAASAADLANVPIVALRRPAWERQSGDRWVEVDNGEAAVEALGNRPRRVFLALGRQELAPVERAPQHHYVVRSVDPVEPPLDLPNVRYILARGPFDEADERNLLAEAGIDCIVCKNSGGAATYGKISAARDLGIDVVMIRRPWLPDVPNGESVDAVEAMAAHALSLADRGE